MNNFSCNEPINKIAFYIFCCKLNHIESEPIASHLDPNLFKIVNNKTKADIFIINSCTVNSKSDQKARRLIQSLLKKYPKSYFLITGCYAQLNPKEILQNCNNCIIIPQTKKNRVLNLENLLKNILSLN